MTKSPTGGTQRADSGLGQVPHGPQRHRHHRQVERLASAVGLGTQVLPFAPRSGWAPNGPATVSDIGKTNQSLASNVGLARPHAAAPQSASPNPGAGSPRSPGLGATAVAPIALMEDGPHGATVLRSVGGLGGRSLECPAGAGSASGFRANGPSARVRSRCGSKQERGSTPSSGLPVVARHDWQS
jgi:hypothetical protein